MLVHQLMSSHVVTVGLETTLPELAQILGTQHFRHLLVMDNQRLVGVITDRDIRRALPSDATSLAKWEIPYLMHKITAKELMHAPVHSVLLDAPISYAAQQMLKYNISCLPVLDGDTLRGIITSSDILKAVAEKKN